MKNERTRVESLAESIRLAEEAAQDAAYKDDAQAKGYAESRSLRLRRELAKVDPRGTGYQYRDLLSEQELADALR